MSRRVRTNARNDPPESVANQVARICRPCARLLLTMVPATVPSVPTLRAHGATCTRRKSLEGYDARVAPFVNVREREEKTAAPCSEASTDAAGLSHRRRTDWVADAATRFRATLLAPRCACAAGERRADSVDIRRSRNVVNARSRRFSLFPCSDQRSGNWAKTTSPTASRRRAASNEWREYRRGYLPACQDRHDMADGREAPHGEVEPGVPCRSPSRRIAAEGVTSCTRRAGQFGIRARGPAERSPLREEMLWTIREGAVWSLSRACEGCRRSRLCALPRRAAARASPSRLRA